MLKIIVLQHYS